MSDAGFRSEQESPLLADCNLGNSDIIIIGKDVPLCYSIDHEITMLSEAGILREIEESYAMGSAPLQAGARDNQVSSSDLFNLEDWDFNDGNFSLDSTLYEGLGSAPMTPLSPYAQTTPLPKSENFVVFPKVEPCSSYEYGYDASPTPEPVHEKPLVAKHRKLAIEREAEDRTSCGPIRRRGRPVKATSNSKQALYAREYRNKNKQLLEEYRQQVEALNERNRQLQQHQQQMADNYRRLQDEFEELQKVNVKLQSEIVPAVTQMIRDGSDNVPLKAGVCVHLSHSGVSLKNCESCKGTSASLGCREPNASYLPFNGDFSIVEQYLC